MKIRLRRLSRAGAALAPLVFLFWARADPAGACSCLMWEPGFLAPASVELPSNARGLPWWGQVPGLPGNPAALPRRAFSVERIKPTGRVEVPFRLEVLTDAPVLDGGAYLVLVTPAGGLAPGQRYRFQYRHQGYPHRRSNLEPQVVEVTVAPEAFEPDPAGAGLGLWKHERGNLQVAAGATCADRVDAGQAGVELESDSALRFRDALLYALHVEGKGFWRYRPHLCAQDVPGVSHVSPGRELLYTVCASSRADLRQDGLREGVHRVRMVAWLPGTTVALQARREVSLRCSE